MMTQEMQRKLNALHAITDFLDRYDPQNAADYETLQSLLDEYLAASKAYTSHQVAAHPNEHLKTGSAEDSRGERVAS